MSRDIKEVTAVKRLMKIRCPNKHCTRKPSNESPADDSNERIGVVRDWATEGYETRCDICSFSTGGGYPTMKDAVKEFKRLSDLYWWRRR